MSQGAGRVDQAIRAMIGRHDWRRQFSSEEVIVAAFGQAPWTAANQRSALRAMHRIVVLGRAPAVSPAGFRDHAGLMRELARWVLRHQSRGAATPSATPPAQDAATAARGN